MNVTETRTTAYERMSRAPAATSSPLKDAQERPPPTGTVGTTVALSRQALEQAAAPASSSAVEPNGGVASLADDIRRDALTAAMRHYKAREDQKFQTIDLKI